MAAKSLMAKTETREDLDAALEQELEPLRAELAKIEERVAKFMAEVGDRKRTVRDEIIAVEREHAEHADRLRDPAAGPDQGVGVG